jgi:hypothetical protein
MAKGKGKAPAAKPRPRQRPPTATVPAAVPQAAAPVPTAPAASPTPAPSLPPVDAGQVRQFMGDATARANELMAALGQGGGGAAGGAGGYGAGAFYGAYSGGGINPSGGFPAEPEDIASREQELLKLDPRYQAEFDRLRSEAEQTKGGFVTLDEQAQADLEAETAAQREAAQRVFNQERDELLLRLYAGGTHQSTMAGEAAGRMLGEQASVEAGIAGDAASRRLALRQALTDNQLKNLALRGDFAGRQADIASNELGMNIDQLERGRDRRAGMWEAKLNAQTELQSASISAGASAAAAGASANAAAEADKFRSLIGLFGDMSRTQEDARQFNAGLSLDRDRFEFDKGFKDRELGQRRLESDRDYDVGKRQVAADRYRTTMGYRSDSERLSFDRDAYNRDSEFRDREFGEDTRRFDLGHQLDRDRFDLDRHIADREHWYRSKQLKYGRRKAIVGSVGSIFGGMMGGG